MTIRNCFFLSLSLLAFLTTNAQEINKKQTFYYRFNALSCIIKCALIYDGQKSMFFFNAKDLKKRSDSTSFQNDNGDSFTNYYSDLDTTVNLVTYQDFCTNSMVSTEILLTATFCILNDTIPRLKWTIKNEFQQIGSFPCQKASTFFRCHQYDVWFTKDIPLSIGPWKLSGLPGLIIEAKSEDNKYSYHLIQEDHPKISQTKSIIEAPTGAFKRFKSFKEYSKFQARELDKLLVFLRSMANGSPHITTSINTQECFDK